jgi:hypothetical protein
MQSLKRNGEHAAQGESNDAELDDDPAPARYAPHRNSLGAASRVAIISELFLSNRSGRRV